MNSSVVSPCAILATFPGSYIVRDHSGAIISTSDNQPPPDAIYREWCRPFEGGSITWRLEYFPE